MATLQEDRPMDGATSTLSSGVDVSPRDIIEPESLKRKVQRDDNQEVSPKRARHDNDDRDRRPRRDSPPVRRSSFGSAPNADHDRRKSATQEEKKRGKRLFGGLLSTLSQTTGSSQQKRRFEIERRQQERQQKQRVEDDKVRAEKLSRLTGRRMSEQVVFEEEVMQVKHFKLLTMAKFLRTKSHPQICYLPWKLTPEQEDEIDDQVRNAKVTIEEESAAVKMRRQRRQREHERPTRLSRSATPEEPLVSTLLNEDSSDKPARSTNGKDQLAKVLEREKSEHQHRHQYHSHHDHHNHHDESADVLEEADEDMVIY